MEKVKKQYCSKCGKCMTSDKGTTLMAVRLQTIIENDEELEFVKQQYGKYELKDYSLCWECWLDSMFKK